MKNYSLKNAFPIVAAALGNKFGVKVSVSGQTARTNGQSINIPAYNLDDPLYKDVAWGYLAHEAAHVRFTNFLDFTNAATSPIRTCVVNIFEDIRIENAIIQAYPGTKFTIEKMDESICRSNSYKLVDNTSHPATILTQFMFLRLSADVLGFRDLKSFADDVELILEETFPVGAVTRLAGILSEASDLSSTRDSVRLADRVLRMIEEEQEIQQEKVRQQQQTKSTQPQDEEIDDLQADQDDSNTGSSSQDDQAQDDSQDQDDSSTGNSSQDDQAQDDSKAGQSQANSAGSNSDDDQDTEQLVKNLSSVLTAGKDDVVEDLIEVVKSLLDSQPRNAYDADVQMPIAMDPERDISVGNALLSEVLNDSGKIRASLQGLVQASQCNRSVNKRSGNRIDGRKLSRLVQGDSRVFQRTTHKVAPNTAMHVLVDGSGSMDRLINPTSEYTLMNLAIKSAMALALALEGISGVNPAVTQFPYEETDDVVPLLKHGQKVRPNASAFSDLTSGSTPLNAALWYAASAVLATREERKVIMVLTDGEPDDIDSVRSTIRRCALAGIELFGVGICYDTSHLFEHSICINNVSELRSELFRFSSELLLAS